VLRTIAVATALSAGFAGSGVPPPNSAGGAHAVDSALLGESDPANPLVLYPRRAGAQYGDIEAPVGAAVRVDGAPMALHAAAVEPGPPPPPEPPPLNALRTLASPRRGFEPALAGTPDTVLHLTLTTDSPSEVYCTLSASADGASATRFARTVDTETAELFFAIGARRGRFYAACGRTLGLLAAGLVQGIPARAVWGLDV
jgi:hypothetical protein